VLLFPGARSGLPKKVVRLKRGLAQKIMVKVFPKGLKVVLALNRPDVEFVKYQLRNPPCVIVSLRKGNKTVVAKRKRKRTAPPEKKKQVPVKRIPPTSPPAKKPEKKKIAKAKSDKGLHKHSFKGSKDEIKKTEPVQQGNERNEKEKLSAATPPVSVSQLPSSKDSVIQDLFEKAKGALEKKRYRYAAKLFFKIMKKAPKTREGEESAYFWAKSLYLKGGQTKRGAVSASEAYKKILAEYPSAPWCATALSDLLDLYKTLTFYNQAIEVGRRILKEYPGSPRAEEALFMIGRLQLRKQTFPEAEKTFEAYLSKYPDGRFAREATFSLGDALYYQGEVEGAVKVYQKALKRWPQASSTDLKTLENMAVIFEKDGRYDRALDLLFTALNISASEAQKPGLLLKIASLYERMNRYREALKIYSKVISQFPKTREEEQATMRMAELSQLHPGIRYKGFNYGPDPYSFPLQAYERILKEEKDPFVVKKALLQKGKLLKSKDPEKTVAVFLKLIQNYPNSPEAKEARKLLEDTFDALIVKNIKEKRYKTCIETYRLYRKTSIKENPALFLHVFDCYLKEGKIALAEKVLNRVKREKLAASLQEIFDFDKMYLTYKKGDSRKAVEMAISFLKRHPKTSKREKVLSLLRRAIMDLMKEKDDIFVASSLKKLLALSQNTAGEKQADVLFQTYVRNIAIRDKNSDRALSLLSWYLKAFPESPECPTVNQMLGNIAYRSGMFRHAETAYRNALKGNFPKDKRAYLLYRLALCLKSEKKFLETKKALGKAGKLLAGMKRDKASGDILWLRREVVLQEAEVLFEEGKTQKAIAAFQSFIKNAPPGEQKDWALYRLGLLYGTEKNLKKVRKLYDTLGVKASDPFWKRNAEDLKKAFGWFVRHAHEFREMRKE